MTLCFLFIGCAENDKILQVAQIEEEEIEGNAYFLPIYWVTKCCCKSIFLASPISCLW